MWQNICFSLPCKTYLSYIATYLAKESQTLIWKLKVLFPLTNEWYMWAKMPPPQWLLLEQKTRNQKVIQTFTQTVQPHGCLSKKGKFGASFKGPIFCAFRIALCVSDVHLQLCQTFLLCSSLPKDCTNMQLKSCMVILWLVPSCLHVPPHQVWSLQLQEYQMVR